ncbi:enoyl-CoA hydratase-related protein [Alkalicoccus urumqiensis]|uniref:Enoyl-CoA hydratase n=1 Tax=Alkalicoccus urumqiensis TaxID=1548213 RepID=A0A2P6ME14_ALKUR|nr:enoyl-CoA hydratase-related protein [Alkalicoccus urumqiensis]PRO64515.1 enoyl-CoA hydratase [Alkalicoccus urumqiensis]
MQAECIRARVEGAVGFIQLHRPHAANALNRQMVREIAEQAEAFDQEDGIRVIVFEGSTQAFAAGADIEEMKEASPVRFELDDPFADWDRLQRLHKPVIAKVSGFALGGGFELALHADVIIAADNAQFGFPEVTLGVLPGAGGTQLLPRLIGQARALSLIWSGERISARQAGDLGICAKTVPPELLDEETKRFADTLSRQAPVALRLIKEAVCRGTDLPLQEGMRLERKNFYLSMGTSDQKEGMRAFIEKRRPSFQGE